MDNSLSSTQLKRTPLYDVHLAAHARIVGFAGWAMPVQYSSIIEEHKAVRSKAGIFDVSHMGRLYFTGEGARDFLQWALVSNVAKLQPGMGQYTLLCLKDGGILDDAVIYMLEEGSYLVVCNAANLEKDLSWFKELMPGTGVVVVDRTLSTGMVALQGPESGSLLESVSVEDSVASLEYFHCLETSIFGKPAFIARTGYTGEDGFELIVDAENVENVWRLLEAKGARPCGLGARDTLRLEACLPLHGSDISPEVNPFEAGLGWVVDMNKSDFVSKAALEAARDKVVRKRLVALEMLDKAIPRHGYAVQSKGEQVGVVTSGGYSPTLEKGIALAYVSSSRSKVGTILEVDIRGASAKAQVVRKPFYRRR